MAFFSLKDIINIIKCNLKLIVIIGILCALAFGGYRGYSLAKGGLADDTQLSVAEEEYNKKMSDYEQQKSSCDIIVQELQSQLATANKSVEENPVMRIDPFNSGYETISISFLEPNKTNQDMINSWINTASTKNLFGKEDPLLEKYKTEIIYTRDMPERTNPAGELLIYVFNAEGIDTARTADAVVKIVKKGAHSANIEINDIVVSHYEQYCQALADLQYLERDDIKRLNEEVKQIKERVRVLEVPSAPGMVTKGVLIKSVLKYLILGLICGLILGIILVLFLIKQGQIIISKRHLDELFDLNYLGDLQDRTKGSLEVIKANLEASVPDEDNLLVIAKERNSLIDDFVDKLDKETKHTVFYGEDLESDLSAIRALEKTKAIICCLYCGKTTYDEIKQVITKAKNMKKQVVGYIVVE